MFRGAGLPFGNGRGYYRFIEDLTASLASMDDATLERVFDLFRGPDGRFAWFLPVRRYEVYGHPVTIFKMGYAWHRVFALQDGTKGARHALCRGIRNEIENALYAFCLGHESHLVDAAHVPSRIDLDLSRIRHRRHTALRERIARQRRAYRSSRTLRVPEARM